MKKQVYITSRDTLFPSGYDYSISEIEQTVQPIVDDFSKDYENVTYRLKPCQAYGYGEDSYTFEVYFYGEETDKEYAARLKREAEVLAYMEMEKVKKEKLQEAKKKKEEALKNDPEYQKYLELQKKFKK